jgi:hypothetical protein
VASSIPSFHQADQSRQAECGSATALDRPRPVRQAGTDASYGPGPWGERETDIVYGCFVHGLSAQQVSDRFHIPEPYVTRVLRRSCDRLLAALSRPAAYRAPVTASGEETVDHGRG